MTSRHDFYATDQAEENLNNAETLDRDVAQVMRSAEYVEKPVEVVAAIKVLSDFAETNKAAARKEFFGE